MDFNVDNWIIDKTIISGNEGSCNAWKERSAANWKKHKGDDKERLDYVVCGCNEDGSGSKCDEGKGECKQITNETWNQIWYNCHGTASKDQEETGKHGKNWDTCANMPVTSGVGGAPPSDLDDFLDEGDWFDSKEGQWMTSGYEGFNNDNDNDIVEGFTFAPMAIAGAMAFDIDDEDQKEWRSWWGNWKIKNQPTFPGLTDPWGPAYPVDISPLIGKTDGDGDLHHTNSCPQSHPRSFHCLGDGVGEDDGPQCGIRTDFGSDVDDIIRFCARDNSEYDSIEVMKCCMGDKGDPSKASVRGCPVDYCRSTVDITDFTLSTGGSNLGCELPIDATKCYQLSDTCHDVFKTVCQDSTLWDPDVEDTTESIELKENCRNWAKIAPTQFNLYAKTICRFPSKDEEDETLSDTLKKSKRKRDYVTRLYNSELCGDWLLKSSDSKDLLMEVCKAAVEKKDDGSYIHTPFDDDMGNLCKCHYPSDYYKWYRRTPEDEGGGGSSDPAIQTALLDLTVPECFYMHFRFR